jgi:hypothetical protein
VSDRPFWSFLPWLVDGGRCSSLLPRGHHPFIFSSRLTDSKSQFNSHAYNKISIVANFNTKTDLVLNPVQIYIPNHLYPNRP